MCPIVDAPILTASRSAWFIAALIWAPVEILFLIALSLKGWLPGAGGVLLILLLANAVALAWVACFRIELTDGGLAYQVLFKRRVTLRLADIVAVKWGSLNINAVLPGRRSNPLPPVRVTIQETPGNGGRVTLINTKMLSREDIGVLQKFLMHAGSSDH